MGMKSLSRMEKGKTEPTVPVLAQVCRKAQYRENKRRVTPDTRPFFYPPRYYNCRPYPAVLETHRLYQALKDSVLSCRSEYLALSGGLDSSIIAHLMREKKPAALAVIAEDFVASDLVYCQMISGNLGIPLDIQSASTARILDAVEKTIRILGNFNDIEVRNSVVMYIAIEHAKRRGARGLITGDGADELFAGYNFFLTKPESELEGLQKRIRDAMHFSSHKIGRSLGVRIESPFLSGMVPELAGSIPMRHKVGSEGGVMYGKWILRKAFEDHIPKKIAWRTKSAMQDGSGTSGLTALFDSVMPDDEFDARKKEIARNDGVTLRTKESMHYYDVFCRHHKLEAGTDSACPYCKSPVDEDSRFCRMCGSWPI